MQQDGKKRIAVYPGTFDPMTYGHLDIIERAAHLFDTLIVGVAAANSSGKNSIFSLEERMELCKKAIGANKKVQIRPVKGLLVDFLKEAGTNIIVRGLRAVSDFDYEFKMNMVNTKLFPGQETVFLMASEKNQFISSSFVKEIAHLGGNVSAFVPDVVAAAILKEIKPCQRK